MVKQDKIFKELLIRHKKSIGRLGSRIDLKRGEPTSFLGYIRKQSMKLALYYADFKCESCAKDKTLTIHHMVRRDNRKFVMFCKYLASRYYFFNIAILCSKCHNKVDGITGVPEGRMVLSKAKIKEIQRYFRIHQNAKKQVL